MIPAVLILLLGWQAGTATEPAKPPEPSKAQTGANKPADPAAKRPRSKDLPVQVAWCIGMGGSFVYLLAVYLGFVGRDAEAREKLLAHFSPPDANARTGKAYDFGSLAHRFAAALLYVGGGGFVAYVFQLTEAELVPVQAFILGCTWPAVVANYVSARQTGEGVPAGARSAVSEVQGKAVDRQSAQAVIKAVEPLAAPVMDEDAKKRMDGLLKRFLGK